MSLIVKIVLAVFAFNCGQTEELYDEKTKYLFLLVQDRGCMTWLGNNLLIRLRPNIIE